MSTGLLRWVVKQATVQAPVTTGRFTFIAAMACFWEAASSRIHSCGTTIRRTPDPSASALTWARWITAALRCIYRQTARARKAAIWTNRSYCTNFDFWWSLYFTGAGAPSNPRLSAGVFENGVTLLWNAASPGVNNAVHTYHVYYRINGGTEYGVDVGANYTSYWLDTTGWGRGTRVDFHLAAITQRGDNPWSGWSGSAYKNNAPNTPTSASVAKTFYAPGETIRVSFTNNGDPDGNMLSVEVARGDNESTLWTNTAGASYVDVNTTGWTPGVPYQLHVRARDSFQVLSGWSNLTAVVMVGLPVFVQPAADGVFRRVVSMQVYVSDTVGFKTVKSMKIAPAQGEINKTVF